MTEYTLQLVDVPAKVTIVEFNVGERGRAQAGAGLRGVAT